jgi:hypothetical protein
VGIDHPVDLTNEVLVGLLRLLPIPNVLQKREKLSELNYRSHNAKNHVKGGHYLPETPQGTHGGEVRWVGAVSRRLVLREVRPGSTDVEPLVDPHLEQERAPRRIASLLVGLVTAEHSPL